MIDCERYWTILQKMQCKTSTIVLLFGECPCLRHWKHLYSWERITQSICIPSKIQRKNLTLKQIFQISEKLILEQSDEIFGVSQISWEDSSWKQFSLVKMKKSSVPRMRRFTYSQILYCVLGKVNQNPTSNTVWEQQLGWFKDSQQYRTLDTVDGEPMEFKWNIFPGFTTFELVKEVQKFMSKMSDPAQFHGRIIFMSMVNDIIW